MITVKWKWGPRPDNLKLLRPSATVSEILQAARSRCEANRLRHSEQQVLREQNTIEDFKLNPKHIVFCEGCGQGWTQRSHLYAHQRKVVACRKFLPPRDHQGRVMGATPGGKRPTRVPISTDEVSEEEVLGNEASKNGSSKDEALMNERSENEASKDESSISKPKPKKSYFCRGCNRGYAQRPSLYAHQRKKINCRKYLPPLDQYGRVVGPFHGGRRPGKRPDLEGLTSKPENHIAFCEGCGRGFTQRQGLYLHQKQNVTCRQYSSRLKSSGLTLNTTLTDKPSFHQSNENTTLTDKPSVHQSTKNTTLTDKSPVHQSTEIRKLSSSMSEVQLEDERPRKKPRLDH